MLTNMTEQSTNQMKAFLHGSRPVGQIKQISYISLLEKNFSKPQMQTTHTYCTLSLFMCNNYDHTLINIYD